MTKTNKKGFTLIELIIVIAILAILIAALSPLLIKWIERSRISKDKSSLDNVYVAINTAIAKEDIAGYTTAASKTAKATWTKLSTLKTNTDKKAEALYKEIFQAADATIDEKYATKPSDVFVSSDASEKEVWYAVTVSGKVLVCLAKDSAHIAEEIGYIGSAVKDDCTWGASSSTTTDTTTTTSTTAAAQP